MAKVIDASGQLKTLGAGGSPTGSAGGDLTGTYPNPTIADNVITTARLQDSIISGNKIHANSILQGHIADYAISGYKVLNGYVDLINNQRIMGAKTFVSKNCSFNPGGSGDEMLGFGVLNTGSYTGSNNTVYGNAAGAALTSAVRLVLAGRLAGNQLTTGFDNVYMGYWAGGSAVASKWCVGIGSEVLFQNIAGSGNTALGFNAGYFGVNQHMNSYLGYNTRIDEDVSDSIALGANTRVRTSGICSIGDRGLVVSGTVYGLTFPVRGTDAASKQYVDTAITNNVGGSSVDLTTDQTISGAKTFHQLFTAGNPISFNQAANKGYVDSGAMILAEFYANSYQPSTSGTSALFDTLNGHSIVKFVGGGNRAATWDCIMRGNITSGGKVALVLQYAPIRGSAGQTIIWKAEFERHNEQSTNLSSDAYNTGAVNKTVGVSVGNNIFMTSIIELTPSEYGNIQAGESFRFRLNRMGASDTLGGELGLLKGYIKKIQ